MKIFGNDISILFSSNKTITARLTPRSDWNLTDSSARAANLSSTPSLVKALTPTYLGP